MTAPVAIVLAGALALGAPALSRRISDRGVGPRAAAALHLLTLLAVGVVPVALLLCVGEGSSPLRASCHWGVAGVGHAAGWVALGAAAALVLWIFHSAASILRATARASVGGLLPPATLPEGSDVRVYVLPVDEPVAYSTGAGRGEVVLSRGLLALLDDRERRAAIAHELAHVRGGHLRLLLVGEVMVRAFGVLAPVRRAARALRRSLEAVADEEAARVVGDPVVVARTIAKVGLAGGHRGPGPGLGLAEESDLAYRIGRLLDRHPRSRSREAAVVGLTALVGLGIAISQCGVLHPEALWAGLAGCGALMAWVGLRPFRTALRAIRTA